jgi:hypothetical protein
MNKMKNDNELNRLVKDHEKRIAHLESLIPKTKIIPKVKNKQTLTDIILGLRENNFFTQPKTASETHIRLKSTYQCEENRIAMALLRLSKRKKLRKATKTIDNKKFQAYVW